MAGLGKSRGSAKTAREKRTRGGKRDPGGNAGGEERKVRPMSFSNETRKGERKTILVKVRREKTSYRISGRTL